MRQSGTEHQGTCGGRRSPSQPSNRDRRDLAALLGSLRLDHLNRPLRPQSAGVERKQQRRLPAINITVRPDKEPRVRRPRMHGPNEESYVGRVGKRLIHEGEIVLIEEHPPSLMRSKESDGL
jgi:hypothetical protein